MPYKKFETTFKGLAEKVIYSLKNYEGTEKFAKVVSEIVESTYEKKPQFKEVIIKSKKAELKAFGESIINYASTGANFLLTEKQAENFYGSFIEFITGFGYERGYERQKAHFRIHRDFIARNGKKFRYDVESNFHRHEEQPELGVIMPEIKKKSIVDGYSFKQERTKVQQKRFDERQEIAWDAVNFGFETALHTPKKENSCISYVCIPPVKIEKKNLVKIINKALDEKDEVGLNYFCKGYSGQKFGYKINLEREKDNVRIKLYARGHRDYQDVLRHALDKLIQSTGILVEDGAEVIYKEKVPAKWTLPFVYTGKGIGFVAKWGTSPVWIPIKYGILWPISKLRDRADKKRKKKEDRLLEEFKRIGLRENKEYPNSCYISINPECMEKITKKVEDEGK
ncbi:MAG: hypothetical protein IB618_00550 [Candidatus Pacearchaeota archaeon]|nr:MAG: hypothetical protein IB618_00550 [Candidatus Pacearchaeota archaeon]